MKNRVVISVVMVLMFILTSCAAKVIQQDRSGMPGGESKEPSGQVQKVKPYRSDVERALDLARKLEDSGSVVEVLRLYAVALNSASVEEREMVKSDLTRFLATLENSKLEELIKSEEKLLPRGEMMYRLGLNQAFKGENQLAIDTLSGFVNLYPDNSDVPKAREIVILLGEQNFNKSTVGCLLPLSGQFSMFGQRALKGVELAIQDLSQEFNQRINVIIKDTRSDDERAVICVDELVRENAAGIAGPIITAEAAASQAQKQAIPMIALTQKNQVAKRGAYVFANFLTPEMQTQALVSYAARVFGVKKFAVLYPDDKYGRTHMDLFSEKVRKAGGEIVGAESYTDELTDFSKPIKRLRIGRRNKSGDDITAIFIPDSPAKLGMILPQLVYHDITGCYLLGTNIWHDKVLIDTTGRYLKNTVITEGFFAKSANPKAGAFAERFRLLHGEDPGFIEAVAYDTLSILIRTAMEPRVNSRDALRESLANKRVFEGVTGRTMFDPDGNAQKELVFLTIENGEFVELTH